MTNDFDFDFQAPGWAAKEKDLSAPAVESAGLTPVLLLGEFPKGPAFAPVNHRNAKAFTALMGLRTNERLGGAPRYMASFHAHTILKESNDLTTVRVLGLSGYLAGASWVIATNTGVVLARLRSRGTYLSANATQPSFAATVLTATKLDGTALTLTGPKVTLDPFKITVTGPDVPGSTTLVSETYQVSLDQDRPDYLPLVLGASAQERVTKVFVEAVYPDTARKLFEDGVATGGTPSYVNAVFAVTSTTVNGGSSITLPAHTDFKTPYREATTPWVVGQFQGSGVSKLLRFITIGDGDAANTELKITFENIDLAAATFDVAIRAFSDTDDNPVVLERFTGMNFNPDSNQYVLARMGGRYEGNSQNEYPLTSTRVLTEVKQNAPVGSVPCGFDGYYHFSGYATGTTPPPAIYKTAMGPLDKPGKFSFGISERAYDSASRGRGLDPDLFQFSGQPNDLSYTQGAGFHLDVQANAILVNTKPRFVSGPNAFSLPADVLDTTSAYANKRNRRFTLVPAGGFDGWDIYRTERTNIDYFRTVAGSDYQAWAKAIALLENPLDAPGEILITSGINFMAHLSLVNSVFDVVHEIRQDCVYITEAPDLGGEPGATADVCSVFENTGLQSSYGTWHSPWVQDVNTDTGNGLVYVSPTGEQARAMALTDKVKEIGRAHV